MTGSLQYQSFQQSDASAVTRRAEAKLREGYSVADTGANGTGDDAAAINAAITNVIASGGGVLNLLNGKTYTCNSPLIFPAGYNGITIDGHGAKIVRGANMPVNQGLFDLRGCGNVSFRNLVVDGAVTVPQGLNYSVLAAVNYDPMYAGLVLNTSFWLHGGCIDIDFSRVTIQHTGGYAILSDTRTGASNQRINIQYCKFLNNRPFLFGTVNNDLNYGSWAGGIFYKGDCGSPVATFVTLGLTVYDCDFERCTGNCVWGHNYGFYSFHSSVQVIGNRFLDCGLDAIQVATTVGGCVTGNTGRRIGYVCIDDFSRSVPRYLANFNATFIDSSGYVEGVAISGNTCTSVCGGFGSLDGYGYGSVTGNNFRQPQLGEAYYVEDQIALVPAGVVYGWDCANTFSVVNGVSVNGGDGICITGNALYGCTAGSIIAISMRNSKIADNDIWQPGNSTFVPILFGNQSAAANQRAYSNSVTGNRIYWSPATPRAAIVESETWSGGSIPWLAGDANWIEKNHIFDSAGKAFEVSLAPSTSSLTGPQISSSVANPTAAGYTSFKRVTLANGTGGYTSVLGTNGTEYFRFADAEIFTVNGGLGTGVVAYLFNSTATGADHAIQQNTGTFFITGAGNAFFQTAVCTTVFNSRSDVAGFPSTTAAFQTSGGTMVIYGDGHGLFQNLTCTTVFNSLSDISGSPSTTAAFQTSTGTFVIFGDGHGLFQNLTCTTVFNSKSDLAGSPSTTAAFQTSTGTMTVFGDGHALFQNLTCTTVFNSKSDIAGSPSTTAAFQTSTGTMKIFGDGHATFQNITCTTVFNSLSDTAGSPSTTAAFQTSTGTMKIFGDGHATFQNITCTTVFNSLSDTAGSPSTTAAFQTSTGTMVIFGDGHATFQRTICNYYSFIGLGAAPTAPAAGFAALYYDTALAALRYNLGGAGWVSISSGGGSPGGANTQIQFNNSGAFGGSASLTWNGIILSVSFVSAQGITVTSNGIDVTGASAFHTGLTVSSGSIVNSGGGNISVNTGVFIANGNIGYTGTVASASGRNIVGGIIV